MLLKYFYDSALAHASYMVGCQKTGDAIIVDPGRDIEQYLEAARKEGMQIIGVADTHIHADYVSGAREMADRIGAKLYVSDEGPAEWKYGYARDYDHQMLKEGDTFSAGKVEFRVMHTPGHTPESVSFILTDKGGERTSHGHLHRRLCIRGFNWSPRLAGRGCRNYGDGRAGCSRFVPVDKTFP